jgi:hypothetical protein
MNNAVFTLPRKMRLSKIAGTFFSWLSKSAGILLKKCSHCPGRCGLAKLRENFIVHLRLSKIAGTFFSWLSKSAGNFLKNNSSVGLRNKE